MFGLHPFEQCQEYIQLADTDGALSIVELSFRLIRDRVREDYQLQQQRYITQTADEAISELNIRFREHSLGYQCVDGCIIRIDSDYIYEEVTAPALTLLNRLGFSGAEAEFLKAHQHYRKGNYGDVIVQATNAFESTIKSICTVRGWNYPETAPAQKLIATIFDKGLIPSELQPEFNALRSTLEAGAPAVRNKPGRGHGAGMDPIAIPPYLAAYVLHLVASNILLLVEAHETHR